MSNPVPVESPRYRIVVLATPVLVWTFIFIDRQIVGILAVPSKAELRLTDTQLGLMGGLAFALLEAGKCGCLQRMACHRAREDDAAATERLYSRIVVNFRDMT